MKEGIPDKVKAAIKEGDSAFLSNAGRKGAEKTNEIKARKRDIKEIYEDVIMEEARQAEEMHLYGEEHIRKE